jgi:hypothetical protein
MLSNIADSQTKAEFESATIRQARLSKRGLMQTSAPMPNKEQATAIRPGGAIQ